MLWSMISACLSSTTSSVGLLIEHRLLHVRAEAAPTDIEDLDVDLGLVANDLLDVFLDRARTAVCVDRHLVHTADTVRTIRELLLVIRDPGLVEDVNRICPVEGDGHTTSGGRHHDDARGVRTAILELLLDSSPVIPGRCAS